MNHKTIISIVLAFGTAILVADEKSNADPFSAATKSETELKDEKITSDVLIIKVYLEKEGKQMGSFIANVSPETDDEAYCRGIIKVSDELYWRFNVQIELEGLNYHRLRIDVEDMNAIKKNEDGTKEPIEIFNSQQQSKGIGNYDCGEFLGMYLKVNITKAEVAPSNPK